MCVLSCVHLFLKGFFPGFSLSFSRGLLVGADGNQLANKMPQWARKLMLHPLPGPAKEMLPLFVTARAESLAPRSPHSGWTREIVRQAPEFNSRSKPGKSQTASPEVETGKQACPINPKAGPRRKQPRGSRTDSERRLSSAVASFLAPKQTIGPAPAGSTRHVSHVTDNPPPR